MPVEIPTDLAPELVGLAWLIGRWEGTGVGGYPTVDDFRFGQEVEFSYTAGKPFLRYSSRSWILDTDGNLVRPAAVETGYWRPRPQGQVEVLLAHPTGYVEIWLGAADGGQVELSTDVVARTESAKEYSAGHRLYGLVEGDLLWAYDMAAMGQPMQPHLSARLKRG